MSKSSEAVKKWRRNSKQRIINAMGGVCQICHYNKCNEALDLHHIDPEGKDFSFGAIRASPVSWDRIVIELRKCILLCANCHREVHNGITILPKDYATFDENYATYAIECTRIIKEYSEFEEVYKNNNYNIAKTARELEICPETARRIRNRKGLPDYTTKKINWKEIDLHALLIENSFNFAKTGRVLGLTDNGVRRRAKKLNLI